MPDSRVHLIDTTLRDGQQSLWALNMRTGTMLAALEHLDRAGFEAMEFFVPVVQIKKMVRDLKEDPFEWLRLGARKARKTPLRLHAGYRSGLGKVPESVGKLLVQKVIDNGITVARISDPWNDFDLLREEHDGLRAMGMESVVNIVYSVSPRHTDAYFLDRVAKAASLHPWRLCLKDVGGLMTPERMAQLLPRIADIAGDIPIEFHGHCNNGLATYNVQKAVELGVRHVHTAVPPLADGSSQPSVIAVAKNLQAAGYDIPIDIAEIGAAQAHLEAVARIEEMPVGRPRAFDATIYEHQVPGGMISNLEYQLRKVGMGHRLPEVLEETARVRADFGYPIMITPLSQFVGTQAVVNVITSQRYAQVTDPSIQYALGLWGREALEHMDPDVRDRILDRPRAREIAAQDYPQPGLDELRRQYGERLSDEELILRTYVDADAVDLVRRLPPPTEDSLPGHSIVELVARLSRVENRRVVSVLHGDVSVTLRKSAETGPPQRSPEQ
ncbi:hypothetical protein [Tranquillimonas alkanivorans]|uniref:Oxaloacetate decarboxylase, alpha subunit n=1 Tax=Tranquillimonas alkanivorans TaxID=441119 RepID=A0A1I5U7U4_9RHOB|nr:hypothetical protein [Tranquillimonas alkanivorans]SFP91007.1 oxaloacetate decarboxylase, alpha subunit [Tranquillimonas alkanivorans]